MSCCRYPPILGEPDFADFSRVRIKLPLNWRTRNRVGTIFGGSLYAAIDPFYMLQLMELLGRDFVVWDKAASIRFRRPGVSTLYAELVVGPERLAEVRAKVEGAGEADIVWPVEFRDVEGRVVAEIEKILYVAKRDVYRRKREAKEASKMGTKREDA